MSDRIVLIVDDNVVNLELYAELVGLTDYRAQMVERAEVVLPAAKEHRPELILLDLTMPGLSGLELARLLKADGETCAIPLIALTAVQRDNLVNELVAAGFAGLIPKPCGVNTFLEALDWAMDGAQPGFRVFS